MKIDLFTIVKVVAVGVGIVTFMRKNEEHKEMHRKLKLLENGYYDYSYVSDESEKDI